MKVIYIIALLLSLSAVAEESSKTKAKAKTKEKSEVAAPEKMDDKALANQKSRFEQLELFNKVLFLVENQYYRPVDTQKLVQGAIKGMLEALDPHSAYLDKEVFDKMQTDTSGEFGGLGIEVTHKDGILIVITPIEDTPAFFAGVKAHDKIVEIDDESTVGMTLEQAIEKMRGKPKSKIKLGIVREGVSGLKHFEIAREVIKLKPVKSELIRDNYAYVRLTQFQKNSANFIVDAINKIRKEAKDKGGLKGLVLDLRSNPGGLLDEAVDVSSIFLKEGVVVSTEGRDPKNKEVRLVNKNIQKELDIPIIVLINGSTASASEIVSGALQDHKRAIIMGSTSFGKGSVQTVAKIDNENGVKLTIAQYMTPNNRKIQAVGITPDVELDETDAVMVEKNKKTAGNIRERDLKGHLVATIETEEEKKARLKEENEDRKNRIKMLERLQKANDSEAEKNKSDKKDEAFKKYEPSTDFQVIQAINFLSALKIVSDAKLIK